jgi:DNA-directed RNA polymerase beta' subunit
MLYVLQKVVGTWMSVEGVTVPIRSVFTSRTDTAHLSHLSLAPEEFREVCHAIVERELGSTQLLSIIKSGAKGSMIHASHMAVALGQQYIGGKPGVFCTNSYSRGLTPDEFFGHQMAAREGVVSTNVTTALTGYLNRRVCKILADIRTQYNGTAGDKYCISSFSVPD